MASDDVDSDLEALRSAVFASLRTHRLKQHCPSMTDEENKHDNELEELRKAALQSKRLQNSNFKRFHPFTKGLRRDTNPNRLNYKRNSNLIVIQPIDLEDMMSKPPSIPQCILTPQDRFSALMDDTSQSPRQQRTKSSGKFSRFETDSEGESSDSDLSESDETNNGKTSPSEDSNNNRSEQNEDSIDVADSDMSDLLVLHPDDNLHESDQLLVNEVDNTPSDDSKPSNNDMLVPQSTSSKVCSEDEDSKEETLKEALRQDVENQIRENVDNKDCDTKEIHSPLKNGKTKSHSHNGGDYGKVNEGPENKSSGKKKSSDHHARSRCRARSRERSLGSRRLKSDVIPDERHHRTGSKKSENVKSKITDNNDRDCVKRNDIKSENGLTESSLKDKMKSSKRYDEMSKNCRRDSPSRCISKSRKSSSKLQSTLNSADRCSRYSDLRNKLIASHKKLNDNSSDDGKDKKERKRLRDKHRSRSGSPVLKSVLTVVNLPESDFRVGGKPRSIKSIAAPLVAVQTPENAVPETSSKAVASDLSRSPKTRKVLILGEERSSSDSEGRSHRRPQINVTLTDDVNLSVPRQRLPVHLRLGNMLNSSSINCSSQVSEEDKGKSFSVIANKSPASKTAVDGTGSRKIKLKWDSAHSSLPLSSHERKGNSLSSKKCPLQSGKAYESDLDEKIRRIRAKNQAILKRKCEIQQDEKVNI